MENSKAAKSYARNREEKKENPKIRQKYIDILIREFNLHRSKNKFYSLRKLAADLGLNYSHLSKVLSNSRGLSQEKAETISAKLCLSFDERIRFMRLVSASCSRSKLKRNLAKMGLKNSLIQKQMFSLKQASAAADAETIR